MKSIFKKSLILGVILVLALSTALLCACNDGTGNGGFKTTDLGENSIRIDGINGKFNESSLNIPAMIDGKTVTQIGDSAFKNLTSLQTIVIPDSIVSIGANAFAGCENLTIYTTQSNPLSGWKVGWNSSDRPIVYGCQYSGGILSFTKSATNPYNINAKNGVNNPTRDSYEFGGWYTTSDFSGTKYDDIVSAPNGTLYARWIELDTIDK